MQVGESSQESSQKSNQKSCQESSQKSSQKSSQEYSQKSSQKSSQESSQPNSLSKILFLQKRSWGWAGMMGHLVLGTKSSRAERKENREAILKLFALIQPHFPEPGCQEDLGKGEGEQGGATGEDGQQGLGPTNLHGLPPGPGTVFNIWGGI